MTNKNNGKGKSGRAPILAIASALLPAAGLFFIVAAFVGGNPASLRFGGRGMDFGGRGAGRGLMRSGGPGQASDGAFPGDGSFVPGTDQPVPGAGLQDGSFVAPDGTQALPPDGFDPLSFGNPGALLPLRYGLGIVLGLIAIAAAVGVWLKKKWGRILALATGGAGLAVSATLIVLGQSSSTPQALVLAGALWPSIVGAVLAAAVLVLFLLPVTRKAFAPVQASAVPAPTAEPGSDAAP